MTVANEARLYSVNPRAVWGFVRTQKASFWFVCIYLFFEYIRPQQIYTAILGPPYARIAIVLALITFVMEQRKVRFGGPEFLVTIFSLVVLLSSVNAFDPALSYDHFSIYFSWVVVYVLIANTMDTEQRFFVFMLSFLLYSFKMAEFGTRSWASAGFAFRSWGTTGSPGWFQNSGEFGIQMCIFLPLIAAFILAVGDRWPRWGRWIAWAAAGTAITSIVGSASRGALIGLATLVIWGMVVSKKRGRTLFAVIAITAFVYVILPAEQKTRLQSMGDDQTSTERTTMWKHGIEMMRDNPILGIGYENWRKYNTIRYGGDGLLVHNTFVQAGSELGYTGLLAFIALIICTFVINRRTRKLAGPHPESGRFVFFMAHGLDGALVGFIASGFFISVLYYPFFWINLAMTVALHNAAIAKFPAPRIAAPNRASLTRRTIVDPAT
jgi:putative inorganic carbon (HCO3(-)) transporter